MEKGDPHPGLDSQLPSRSVGAAGIRQAAPGTSAVPYGTLSAVPYGTLGAVSYGTLSAVSKTG